MIGDVLGYSCNIQCSGCDSTSPFLPLPFLLGLDFPSCPFYLFSSCLPPPPLLCPHAPVSVLLRGIAALQRVISQHRCRHWHLSGHNFQSWVTLLEVLPGRAWEGRRHKVMGSQQIIGIWIHNPLQRRGTKQLTCCPDARQDGKCNCCVPPHCHGLCRLY